MGVSRAERRSARRDRIEAIVGVEHADAALDLLELLEFAWHDCYGEISPPEAVIDQVLVVSRGTIAGLVHACRLAVADRRDLQVAALALED